MRVLLLATLVLAGCLAEPGPMPAPEPAPFVFEANGCVQVSALVPVALDAVRDRVPARYAIQGAAGGGATVFVGIVQCDNGTLDAPFDSPAWTAVGVVVESPDGSEATHSYLLWWLSDAAPLADALGAWGIGGSMPSPTVVDAVQVVGPGRVGSARASVPWLDGSYDVQVDVAGPATAQDAVFAWWQDTRDGTVRFNWTLNGALETDGFGRVNAATGPLREILGQESIPGAAFYVTGKNTVSLA